MVPFPSLPSPGSNFPVAQTLVGYYSGIPSVSHPPSSKLARKSEQFFGNRRLYLHHRNGKEEGSGGVLFANFHDLSLGWRGERKGEGRLFEFGGGG